MQKYRTHSALYRSRRFELLRFVSSTFDFLYNAAKDVVPIFNEPITFTERDREKRVAATFFLPSREPTAVAIVLAAMGVTQKYYADYAAWLAEQGIAVVTFDYRGIGESGSEALRDCSVTITQWAEGDCAAVIDATRSRFPDKPHFVVGHSLGAQIVGMIPNRRVLDGMLIIASGSGYWRKTSTQTRFASLFLFYFLAPVLTGLFGYFPGKSLRAVGNLPRGVIRQWRRWCLDPEYLWGVEDPGVRAASAALRMSMLSLSVMDDEMMSAQSTDDLHAFFPNAAIEKKRITPASIGADRIGHFGFFRKRFADSLWPMTSGWIAARISHQGISHRA